MLMTKNATPKDEDGKRLALLSSLISKANFDECCALQIIIPLVSQQAKAMAVCYYCGKIFRNGSEHYGAHIFECPSEANPFHPFQLWEHKGEDAEENTMVLEKLKKSVFLQGFVESNCCHHFIGLASSKHLNTITQVMSILGCSSDTDNPELFDLAEKVVSQKNVDRLKQVDGCFLYFVCIHNTSAVPVGLLLVSLDTDGVTSIMGSVEYSPKRSVERDQELLFVSTLKTCEKEGINVMGFIQHGDKHCGRLIEFMYDKYAELMQGMLWLVASEQHTTWVSELQKAPSLWKLATPVIKIQTTVKNNVHFKQLLDKCLEVNKIKEFYIYSEKELRNTVNFYELWMKCGTSFFNYMEVYRTVQNVAKKQKEWAKDTPADFDYFMSIQFNPETRAFKAALQSLLLVNAYTLMIKEWKSFKPKNRTQEAAKNLVTAKLRQLEIPEDLRTVAIDAITRDLMNENKRMIPRSESWETFEIFITYQASEDLEESVYSKEEVHQFFDSINLDKERRKRIKGEFNHFLAQYPITKAKRFGEAAPKEFWKQNREQFPLLAPLALAMLSLPKGNDELLSVEMTDHVLSNMFLHINNRQTEPLRRLHFWFNQFRVPYLEEVEDLLVWSVCYIRHFDWMGK